MASSPAPRRGRPPVERNYCYACPHNNKKTGIHLLLSKSPAVKAAFADVFPLRLQVVDAHLCKTCLCKLDAIVRNDVAYSELCRTLRDGDDDGDSDTSDNLADDSEGDAEADGGAQYANDAASHPHDPAPPEAVKVRLDGGRVRSVRAEYR